MNTAVSSSGANTDFADWLSPILVKELRQGLKTRMFVSVFILLQAAMIVVVGLQLLSLSQGAGRSSMDGFEAFFWALIWIPLLVVMPARGLVAVSEEMKANTLDLVQMTKLTASRIVFGKWVALVAQTLLLTAAVLPYTVLRYFFGQVDTVEDLRMIVMMLGGSVTLTAAAIALSCLPVVVRVLILVISAPFLIGMAGAIHAIMVFGGSTVFMSSSGSAFEEWWLWVMEVVSTAAYVFFLLEIAAGKIAPVSENHSGRRRLLALTLAVVIPLAVMLMQAEEGIAWLLSYVPLWAWAMLEALCERTTPVASVYQPLAVKGWWGRLAGRVLYPGWASGLVFSALLFVLLGGMLAGAVYLDDPTELEFWEWFPTAPLLFSALVLPVLVLLMFPRMKQPVWLYLLVQGLFGLIYLIAVVTAEVPGFSSQDQIEVYRWLALFPASALLGLLTSDFDDSLGAWFTAVTLPVCGLVLAVLAYKMMREFGKIRKLEREAVERA